MTRTTLPSLPIIADLQTVPTSPTGGPDAVWSWADPSEWHLIDNGPVGGTHHSVLPHNDSKTHLLFVTDGSRVFDVDAEVARSLQHVRGDALQQRAELESLGLSRLDAVCDDPPSDMQIRAMSLAVAQKCNLGCSYCYAEGGSFGGLARNMSTDVALQAVEKLFLDASSGDRVNLSFLGGEPLVNRDVVRLATQAAVNRAETQGVSIGLSITTNGTLITPADAEFFERYGFAVTISLDGVGATHDSLRPYKGGRGSYDEILRRVTPLLATQSRMQVSARVTVTPRNLCLRETLEELIGLRFHSVGFSPMLSSPTGRDEMGADELQVMLRQMIDCAHEFERRVLAGERFPFSNMVNAMQEIHRGTHRPYPCGAGGAYFGVSADGELFACHRFVDDSAGKMGDLDRGVDAKRQAAWLAERHVHRQEPCSSCWARYLCGGGCHHEVIHRGRPACDYIRGWLHYCLQAYARLLDGRPDYFGAGTD